MPQAPTSVSAFQQAVLNMQPSQFQALALALFRFQAQHNTVYKQYLAYLGVQPQQVQSLTAIPFLPVSFFKQHKVVTGTWQPQQVYQSSGTTGQTPAQHYIHSVPYYLQIAQKAFEQVYGPLTNYHVFGLLPGYLERGQSSLVAMVNHFMQASGSTLGGFYLYEHQELLEKVQQARQQQDGRKVLVIGVTYALLDLAEGDLIVDWGGAEVTVMVTGGMKGLRKEMVFNEVSQRLQQGLGVSAMHSEYGGTELLSQAYSVNDRGFKAPAWMKVLGRELNDPFAVHEVVRQGGVNVIDLANVHSCAFLELQDLVRIDPSGHFHILGRFDNSEVRGCNLMV